MRFFSQFEHLDPLKGQLPWAPFHEAQNILGRARTILRYAHRTEAEIQDIATEISNLIEMYFDHEKARKLEEIRSDKKFNLLETDDDGVFTDFTLEAIDEYNIHTPDNTPDLDALIEAMGYGFDPANLEDVKDVKEYEFFAVYAIWFLADYARDLDYELDFQNFGWKKREQREYGSKDVVTLSRKLFDALETVCFAERLRAVERVEEKYQAKIEKLQAGQAVRITQEDYKRIEAEIRADIAKENSVQQRERSEANNNIRHETNRNIKQSVLDDFAKAPRRFDSAEKAADHYVDDLQARGIERSHRTVADWIREYARNNGIRYR